MKKLLIIMLLLLMILFSSCDFVKERFLDGDPLYGGGYEKGTSYIPSPSPSASPSISPENNQ